MHCWINSSIGVLYFWCFWIFVQCYVEFLYCSCCFKPILCQKVLHQYILLSSCSRVLIEIFLCRILRRVCVCASAVKFDEWRHNSGRHAPSSLGAVHVDAVASLSACSSQMSGLLIAPRHSPTVGATASHGVAGPAQSILPIHSWLRSAVAYYSVSELYVISAFFCIWVFAVNFNCFTGEDAARSWYFAGAVRPMMWRFGL